MKWFNERIEWLNLEFRQTWECLRLLSYLCTDKGCDIIYKCYIHISNVPERLALCCELENTGHQPSLLQSSQKPLAVSNKISSNK